MKKIFPIIVVLISLSVLGIIFIQMSWINNAISLRQKQHEQDQKTVEQMGGSELAIQSFYGNSQIRRGQSAQLCYGVANAKKVTLDPPAGPVWPSYSRCLDVSPSKTTTYTLTASDDAGHSASQTFTVKVQ